VVADLDGSGATEVAPVSGTIDNATFRSTPDGRRIVVLQDRFANGSYALYEFDRGLGDGGDVKAVVLNVTAVNATAPGYVTVWPSGAPQPVASNINLDAAGQTRPNLVTVQPASDGSISLYTSGGAHLLADVAGYYTFAANARAGRMFPLPPDTSPRHACTRRGAGGGKHREACRERPLGRTEPGCLSGGVDRDCYRGDRCRVCDGVAVGPAAPARLESQHRRSRPDHCEPGDRSPRCRRQRLAVHRQRNASHRRCCRMVHQR
jgi:hypothetical protein